MLNAWIFSFVVVCIQNQACTAFQQCAASGDPAMCLQQMLTALSTLAGPGGAGGAPVGGAPCQGGAGAPMPMPPMPMPMPMPMPQPMPYPEQVIVEPSSCGGTYPCGDKASKDKKHHDKKEKKHHKSHKEDDD